MLERSEDAEVMLQLPLMDNMIMEGDRRRAFEAPASADKELSLLHI